MSPKKKPTNKAAFTSLRIIGKKAQKIIETAKQTGEEKKASKAGATAVVEDDLRIHVSTMSVVRAAFTILAIVAGTWLIIQVRDKIIILLLAMFVAAVIDPGVQLLERYGLPRALAVLVQYFIFLFLLFFLVVSLIPIIADQVQEIVLLLSVRVDSFLAAPQISLPLISDAANQQMSNAAEQTLRDLNIAQLSDALQRTGQNLSSAATQSVSYLVQVTGSVVRFMATLIVVLVFGFFMQLEKERMRKWGMSFLPDRYRMYVNNKIDAIYSKISQWARGELVLCFSIFCLTLLALTILQMDYKLTLAVFAGFCEFIPAVGPFIAAVPAVLIAVTQKGLFWGVFVAGVYYAIQWCENNLLVPLIMNRAVGLSPIAILFAMMIGISFPDIIHPVLGVMLAIPTTTILSIFLEDMKSK